MMSSRYFGIWRPLLVLLAGAGLSSAVWAQGLSDPTRPAVSPTGAAADGTQDDAAGVNLLLTTATRKYALVGGELLAPGQTGSQGKLVEIRPNGVVVQTANGRETLNMYPGVVKQPARPVDTKAKARPTTITIGNSK
jgi:hypothetical protein